jgi:flagellar biosynthesis protein FlhF
MEVKTYRAASMQEALALVRADLGPQAAVLHTREVGGGGLLGWFTGSRKIEVTAALDVRVPSRFADRRRASAASEAAGTEARGDGVTYEPSYAAQSYDDGPAGDPPPARTPPRGSSSHAPSSHAPSSHAPSSHASAHVPSRSPAARTPAASSAASHAAPAGDDVRTQLSELQALVADLCRRSRGAGHQDLPESLFRLYTDLIEAEVADSAARDLIEHLRRDVAPDEMDDPIMLRARLSRTIEERISASGPIVVEPGRRRLVALVGPTGVGKTTTIAKLAANYRLREKRRVGLITVDTYRVAAVEQLRTYADIIDLPMHVVSTPREMRDAVNSLSSLDLVLLDTAGRSPHDEVKIQELKSFLVEAGADEVHLVLSATSGASALEKTARQFAAVGTTHLLLTKLDEAAALGHLMPLFTEGSLPLSYLTDGQSVPDDIAPAEAARLARLILGIEAPQPGRRPATA